MHLGTRPPVEPGELIPDTYGDIHGKEQPVDFERLLELGAAEKVSARQAKADQKAENLEPLTREDLDAIAVDLDLDPADYANKPDLIDAIQAARQTPSE